VRSIILHLTTTIQIAHIPVNIFLKAFSKEVGYSSSELLFNLRMIDDELNRFYDYI